MNIPGNKMNNPSREIEITINDLSFPAADS